MVDSSETQLQIEKTVIQILKTSDMDEMTEAKVRKMAGEKLGIDLSATEQRRFVRGVVDSFLLSNKEKEKSPTEEKEEEDEVVEEEEEEGKKPGSSAKEYDDSGDLIVCRLSSKRRVTIQDFKGKTLVSIREYYDKGGKELPSSKGISLTAEQWSSFSKAVPAIDEAINKMQTRLR